TQKSTTTSQETTTTPKTTTTTPKITSTTTKEPQTIRTIPTHRITPTPREILFTNLSNIPTYDYSGFYAKVLHKDEPSSAGNLALTKANPAWTSGFASTSGNNVSSFAGHS